MSGQKVDAKASALMILAGMATLGFSDNLVATITENGSLWQFHFIRGGMAALIFCAVGLLGFGRLRPRKWGAVLGRSLIIASAMLIYFGSLAYMPIGVVVAGLFTAPMFVLLIAVVFQGRRVGPFRWGAVAIGFAGVVMVIEPDPGNLNWLSFLPILAGALYAVGAVATRAWCEGEGTVALCAVFFAVLSVMGAVGIWLLPEGLPVGADGFALRGWMPLTSLMLLSYFIQAIGAVVGIAFLFGGYQRGDASFVAIFEYSMLVFATSWAWILWGETVAPLALMGMALIVLAGAIIALRGGNR